MRKVKLIIVVVVAAASIWIGWSIIRARLLSKGFERIAIGDSRDQVMHLLGKPWRIERCGVSFGNPGGKPGCMEDYLYASPYAPVIPQYWSVSFDQTGHVIEKYQLRFALKFCEERDATGSSKTKRFFPQGEQQRTDNYFSTRDP